MSNPWFYWAIIGILCIGLEMVVPGFVIFFFGAGAILTSVLSLIPFIANSLAFQIFLFLVFSIVSLIFLRKKFSFIFKGSILELAKKDKVDEDYGQIVQVVEDIKFDKEGRIKFKGTTWNAILKEGSLSKGESAKIVKRENLTYIVEKFSKEE